MFISTAKSLFIFYQPADPEPAPGCLFRSLYSIKTTDLMHGLDGGA